jgi:hypothetical protein
MVGLKINAENTEAMTMEGEEVPTNIKESVSPSNYRNRKKLAREIKRENNMQFMWL